MAKKPKTDRYANMLTQLIKGRHLTQQAFVRKVRETSGVRITQARLSLLLKGQIQAPDDWRGAIASTFGLTEEQRQRQEKAAALDAGFEVELPPVPQTEIAAGDHPAAVNSSSEKSASDGSKCLDTHSSG